MAFRSGEESVRQEIAAADVVSVTSLPLPGLDRRRAWAFFAETDLLNHALGNPTLAVSYGRNRRGGFKRTLTTREPEPVTYHEELYQWEEETFWAVRREFDAGPVEKIVFLFTYGCDDGCLQFVITLGGWARSPELLPQVTALIEDGIPGAFQTLRSHFEHGHEMAVPGYPRPKPMVDPKGIEAAYDALVALGEEEKAVESFTREISTALDHELKQMSPRALARRWNLDVDCVVNLFLRAVRLNLVAPRWSVVCPSCRGGKEETRDVGALPREVHCPDCDLRFSANPRENLQLTFEPTARLRQVEPAFACVGGPARTPHVKAQVFVDPGASNVLIADVERCEGSRVRLSCPATGAVALTETSGGRWLLDEDGLRLVESLSEGVVLENGLGERVRVTAEEPPPYRDVLLAGEVLENARFRELFAADQWEFLAAMNRSWAAAFSVDPPLAEPTDGSFDLVVLGSGPSGESTAMRAAALGARVAVIESRELFGGPSGLTSKAFRESALKVLEWTSSQRAEGPQAPFIQKLFDQRFAEYRRFIELIASNDVKARLGRAGIILIAGMGRLLGANGVEVVRDDGRESFTLEATHIVVATGSRPRRPASIPFDDRHVVDSTALGEIDRLPRKVCIIGGGIVGCEYASILVRLGVEVTLLSRRRRLLGFLDADLASALVDEMRCAGVRFIHDASYSSIRLEKGAELPVTVELDDGRSIACDLLLFAEGREGAGPELECDAAGVRVDGRGFLSVNEDLQTSAESVYAIGDVIGPPGLASAGARQGRVLADRLFGGHASGGDARFPTTLWTLPEVATVGESRQELVERGVAPLCGRAFYRDLARGALECNLSGWLELVARPETGELAGVHIIGASACELIHYGAALLGARSTLQDVADAGYAAITYHGLYQQAAERAILGSRAAGGGGFG